MDSSCEQDVMKNIMEVGYKLGRAFFLFFGLSHIVGAFLKQLLGNLDYLAKQTDTFYVLLRSSKLVQFCLDDT